MRFYLYLVSLGWWLEYNYFSHAGKMKVMKENRSQCKIFYLTTTWDFLQFTAGDLSAIHSFSIVIHPFRCFSTFPGSNLASIGCVNGPIRGLNHQQRRNRPSKRPNKDQKNRNFHEKDKTSNQLRLACHQLKINWDDSSYMIHWHDSIWHLETTKSSWMIKTLSLMIITSISKQQHSQKLNVSHRYESVMKWICSISSSI